MKSYCLLLVVLCSAFIIQDVNSTTLRRKTSHHFSAKTGGYTPTNNIIQITNYDGIQARDVGVGADGTIWYVSNTKSGNDYSIYRMTPDSNTWELIPGAATYISVANDGNAWIVRANTSIARYTGSEWKSVTGAAYDISCAPDGNVYHIGGSNRNSIYMLNRAGTSWDPISGITGTRVAGGVAQSVIHVNSAHDIYRTIPNTWEKMTGSATDIAIGANGLVWISTTGTKPNQLAVFDEKKQDWINVPLAAYLAQSGPISGFTDANIVRVAVAPNGDLIGVKDDFTMFRMRYNWSN